MSKQEERKRLVQDTTNDLLLDKFTQSLGNKVRVERTPIQSDHMDQLREVIAEVGKNLEEAGIVPKGMEYKGSLSVHVYMSEVLRTAAFATVSETKRLDLALADGALRELTGNTYEALGKKRKKMRSGF